MTATVIATGEVVEIVNAEQWLGSDMPIVLQDAYGNLYLPYELKFASNTVTV